MDIKDLGVDKTWTLFLDRDGVINEKLEKLSKRVDKQELQLDGFKVQP